MNACMRKGIDIAFAVFTPSIMKGWCKPMKKLMLIACLLMVCVLFAGCSNQNVDIPVMEEPQHELTETVLTETILWENVLVEEWD